MNNRALGMTAAILFFLPLQGRALDDEVAVLNSQPGADPLVHINLDGQAPSEHNDVRVLGWTRSGDDIDLFAELNPSGGDGASAYNVTFSIPAPRPGDYHLRYHVRNEAGEAFELAATAPLAIGTGWPERGETAFVWPPDPTPLSDVRYFFTRQRSCRDHEILSVDLEMDDDRVEGFLDEVSIERREAECDRIRVPGLQEVTLGNLRAGMHHLEVFHVTESSGGQTPPGAPLEKRPMDVREFEVRRVLPGQLSGSWYNPEQSGHGLALEVMDGGERLLAYWFTFDATGSQAWLIASGVVDDTGTAVTLEADVFQGGFFPPAFDSSQVEDDPWGTIRLDFESCNRGTMSWDTSQPAFADGEMTIERLTTISGHGCETQPPAPLMNDHWRVAPYPVLEELAEPPA